MLTHRTLAAIASLSLALTLGCRIETDKKGDSDNVSIATPFGGMAVKTNDAAVLEGIGLPPYPGAELVKKDKNNGAADVNMNFGDFHLRVKAVSYRTTDAPTQVAAFYRKALDRYGDVIQCVNDKPVGNPTRTAEGLTCDHDSDHDASDYHQAAGKVEFRAGSKVHEHIVAIEPEGSGSKFGLVALELPGRVSVGDTKGEGKQ